MKDIAEIVKIGKACWQVNIINARTNLYYNSSSRRFKTKEEAVQYARNNELIIK